MSVLCSMVGASFTVTAVAQVLRSKKGVSAFGNTSIDTVQSKFSGTSVLFDGTGDYLLTSGYAFGTSNFTVEYWIRPRTALSGYDIHWDLRGSNTSQISPIIFTLNGVLTVDVGSTTVITGSTLSINTWYHIALCRSGSSTKLFVNGTQVGSTYTDTNNYLSADNLYIGNYSNDQNLGVNGYMDEFRISNSARYTANFTEPTAPFVNDANTVLLLHMDGGETLTYFPDDNGVRAPVGARTNNSATTSITQSKFGGSSAYMNGSSFIICPGNFTQTGNFTFECWVRRSSITGTHSIISIGAESTGRQQLRSNGANFQLDGFSTSGVDILQTGTSYAANTWYHLAVVRNDSTVTLYQNGTSIGSASYSGTFGQSSNLYIGGDPAGSFIMTEGYVDEVRVSNSARYTANFTAPTTPFTNDANTLLLLHCDGPDGGFNFPDDNGQTPPTVAEYNTDYYASFLKLAVPFDGDANDVAYLITGTGLTVASTKTQGASSTISGGGAFGEYANSLLNSRAGSALTYALPSSIPTSASGTYVVEGWFAASDSSENSNWALSSADSGGRWLLGLHTGSTSQYASENWQGIGTGWNHCAIVCDAGTKRFYVNGVYKNAFSTESTGFSTLHVGQFNDGDSNDFIGRIQDLRVYVGTNKGYTGTSISVANFVLPQPIKKIRTQKGIIANGNAQVDTAQSKFGGASALFDGTGDYLDVTTGLRELGFGRGDFTVEGWFRFANTTVDMAIYTGSTTNGDLDIRRLNDNTLRIGRINVAWDLTSGATGISANTWYHIAFVRNSGTATIYVNGTSVGSGSNTQNYVLTTQLRIGAYSSTNLGFNGHMDELRVSNIARYTAGFTAPTAPFQNDSNTLLLLHMDGTDASTAFFDDNGIAPYTP